MAYSYDRVASSNYGNPLLKYEDRLESLQATFTGEVAEYTFEYLKTLHNRLGNKQPYADIVGFNSWDYGSPQQKSPGVWQIRVYQSSSSNTYPAGLHPNILILLEFTGGHVNLTAKMYQESLVQTITLSTNSRGIATRIGEAWEKALTGAVDYGRFQANTRLASYMAKWADAMPSPEEQLKRMKAHPPKMREKGEFFVIELFSPILNEYMPQGGHRNEEVAERDLAKWKSTHQEAVSRLEKTVKNASLGV